MACFAASGAGTKRVRRALGSERIRASTFSSRRPGTSQASGAAATWFRASSGTRDRHAVLRLARLEAVVQRQFPRARGQPVGEGVFRNVGPFAEQIGLGHGDLPGVFRRLAEPAGKLHAVVNLGRQPLIVEGEAFPLADHDVALPQLGLQPLDLVQQFLVVHEECRLGLQIALHQAMLDQELPRGVGVDRPIAHRPSRDDHQPEQRQPLQGHGRGPFASQCSSL